MVSKPVNDSINDAKAALDQVETLGKTAYDICDGILTNVKALVHDDGAWDKINKYEEKVHKEFKGKIEKAREKLKNVDPLYAWNDGLNYYMELRHWKSLEMLSFWDKLSKEYDI